MELVSAAIIESAEASLNLLLQTRPMLQERLAKLAGKTVRITLAPQEWSLLLRLTETGIELSTDKAIPADVSVRGELSVLLKLATEPRAVLFGQGAEVEGDIALLQRLQKAMREPGLDWELWLSEQLGDLPTAALMQAFGPIKSLVQQNQHSLSRNLKSYLQEELEALPARAQYEGWAESVSATQQQVDQLARRLNQLNQDI